MKFAVARRSFWMASSNAFNVDSATKAFEVELGVYVFAGGVPMMIGTRELITEDGMLTELNTFTMEELISIWFRTRGSDSLVVVASGKRAGVTPPTELVESDVASETCAASTFLSALSALIISAAWEKFSIKH